MFKLLNKFNKKNPTGIIDPNFNPETDECAYDTNGFPFSGKYDKKINIYTVIPSRHVINFKDGKKDGMHKVYDVYDMGHTYDLIKSVEYKNGAKHGDETLYRHEKSYKITPYINGKKNGIERWFDNKGDVKEAYYNENGKEIKYEGYKITRKTLNTEENKLKSHVLDSYTFKKFRDDGTLEREEARRSPVNNSFDNISDIKIYKEDGVTIKEHYGELVNVNERITYYYHKNGVIKSSYISGKLERRYNEDGIEITKTYKTLKNVLKNRFKYYSDKGSSTSKKIMTEKVRQEVINAAMIERAL